MCGFLYAKSEGDDPSLLFLVAETASVVTRAPSIVIASAATVVTRTATTVTSCFLNIITVALCIGHIVARSAVSVARCATYCSTVAATTATTVTATAATGISGLIVCCSANNIHIDVALVAIAVVTRTSSIASHK